MRLMGKFAVVALFAACTSVAYVQAEGPATKPSDKPNEKMHGPKLTKPYSDMKTLTPEEKEKIAEIHKKAREEVSTIDDKEDADILALLTPEQKAELETLNDAKKVKTKSKAAEKKAKATTEPAT